MSSIILCHSHKESLPDWGRSIGRKLDPLRNTGCLWRQSPVHIAHRHTLTGACVVAVYIGRNGPFFPHVAPTSSVPPWVVREDCFTLQTASGFALHLSCGSQVFICSCMRVVNRGAAQMQRRLWLRRLWHLQIRAGRVCTVMPQSSGADTVLDHPSIQALESKQAVVPSKQAFPSAPPPAHAPAARSTTEVVVHHPTGQSWTELPPIWHSIVPPRK